MWNFAHIVRGFPEEIEGKPGLSAATDDTDISQDSSTDRKKE
jgi:hypothetical protein